MSNKPFSVPEMGGEVVKPLNPFLNGRPRGVPRQDLSSQELELLLADIAAQTAG